MSSKIIVVEDEVIIADEINTILEKAGYRTFEPAISYNEAITAFFTTDPDLIILDVELTGNKNGLDVAKSIRKYSPQVPLLFLTGCTDPQTEESLIQVKPQACIDKVFFEQDLLGILAQVLPS